MYIKKALINILLSASLFLVIDNGYSKNTINSLEIVENTLNGLPNCIHYKIVGLCLWLQCSIEGCNIDHTLKIDHYLPDLVVSSYTKPTNNPWWFAQHVEDPIFYKVGKSEIRNFSHFKMGFGNEYNNSQRDLNNKFHEIDIIGNPILSVLNGYNFVLRSTVTPYKPYYSSLIDAYAWRFPALEQLYPGSLILGLHEVGTLVLHDWGPVYPRNGYVNQPDDAKAAAVDALRASTIITSKGQPHIYIPLSQHCGEHCIVYSIKENSKDAQYQMIYPNREKRCVVFGGSDIANYRPWESDASYKGHNRYIWVLWRHYHGCIPSKNAKYLGSIDF